MSGAEELVSDFGVHQERMEQRMLGQGLRASAIGLGCMGMSEFYGPVDERESIATIHRELGIGFLAYSPLGRGFLSGRFRRPEDLSETDWRRSNPRFASDNFARNQALVERVEAIASRKGVTASQIALAWVLAQRRDIVPIPGTKQRKYIEENARATTITLTPEERRELDEAFPKGVAAGERYPEGGMRAVNR